MEKWKDEIGVYRMTTASIVRSIRWLTSTVGAPAPVWQVQRDVRVGACIMIVSMEAHCPFTTLSESERHCVYSRSTLDKTKSGTYFKLETSLRDASAFHTYEVKLALSQSEGVSIFHRVLSVSRRGCSASDLGTATGTIASVRRKHNKNILATLLATQL